MKPYINLPAVEVPGVGQIKAAIFEDDITRAEYALATGGADYALTAYSEQLKQMISQRTWRSAAAAELLNRITRLAIYQAEVFDAEKEEACSEIYLT